MIRPHAIPHCSIRPVSIILLLLLTLASPLFAATRPSLSFSTYFGGGGEGYNEDPIYDLAIDASGRPCVVGHTTSPDFPFTNLRYKPSGFDRGSFVARFSTDGSKLEFSTFIPGCYLRGIAIDGNGDFLLVGRSYNDQFPVTNAVQASYGGGATDAVALKLGSDGQQLRYATFLGGESVDLAYRVAVDDQGSAYVAGWTTSAKFPVTSSAAQTSSGGGFDGFVTKLSADGSVIRYSTYLGGARADSAVAIVIDAQRRAYVTGFTGSPGFAQGRSPVRIGPAGTQDRNAYVARLVADGSSFDLLTYLGGSDGESGTAIALDAVGNIVLFGQTASTNFPTLNPVQPAKAGVSAGETGVFDSRTSGAVDHFLSILDPSGARLIFSTFFGGSSSEDAPDPEPYVSDEFPALFTESGGVAVAGDGTIWITSRTDSNDLPGSETCPKAAGGQEAYVANLDVQRSQVTFLNYLGGASDETPRVVHLDRDGGAWVAGSTAFGIARPFFPTTPGTFQPGYGGSVSDGFLAHYTIRTSPPPNDSFAGRQPLEGPRLTLLSDSSLATAEPGEPSHAGLPPAHSLWWTWTAHTNGTLSVSTAGSDYDTVLAIYEGAALAGLKFVAAKDDEDANEKSGTLRIPVQAGQILQIAVGAKSGRSGTARLALSFSAPANDDFVNRRRLVGFPAADAGSNVDATYESGFRQVDPTVGGRSIWWEWMAPISAHFAVTTVGSDFDTDLTLLTTNAMGEKVEVDHSNDYENSRTSQVAFGATQGSVYFICVDGVRGSSGLVRLALASAEPPPNDSFAGRIVIPGFGASLVTSNHFATIDADDPPASALGFETTASSTMWWSWNAPTNGLVRVNTVGSGFDTRLAIFTGETLSSLHLVAANDNDVRTGGRISRLEFRAAGGTTYQILVEGGPYDRRGTLSLSFQMSLPSKILPETVTIDGTGAIAFEVEGLPGLNYAVEGGNDLAQWRRLTVEPRPGPRFRFQEPSATGFKQFYRVIELP